MRRRVIRIVDKLQELDTVRSKELAALLEALAEKGEEWEVESILFAMEGR
jgi:hypothetical protein